ncbi:MAG: outer membrane beta-barrel protein, partial [Lutibacter sp.]
MKKYLFILVASLIATTASAQFYVSATGGYAVGSAGVLMGTSLNAGQTEAKNHYGSYGEGANYQIRTGYMFNDMFGVELGVGYLHGDDQNKDSYVQNDDGSFKEITDAIAYGRAYGLTASLVYKFTKNVYGRFGALTKIGGKTVAEFTKNTTTPFGPIVSVGKQDYHGRFPFGFNAALGYKHAISNHFTLFAELEYLGIKVTRDYSEFESLS